MFWNGFNIKCNNFTILVFWNMVDFVLKIRSESQNIWNQYAKKKIYVKISFRKIF